jgi:cell division transport system permease protein
MTDRAAEAGKGAWKPAPLLPREDERDGALVFVVAVLCFLACAAALAALAADRAAQGWRAELSGEILVQARPRPEETSATAAARAAAALAADRAAQGWRAELSGEILVQARPRPEETSATAAARAAAALAGVKGVVQTEALPEQAAEALLEPWLGKGGVEDLPVPHLVIVELDPEAPATPETLSSALRAAGVEAVVHDYDAYLLEVRRAGQVARVAAVGVAALIATAAGAVIAFATRAGMTARRDVLEVLHLSGAEDRMLARLFQMRFARLALAAGLMGGGSAALVASVVRGLGGSEGFLPILPIEWADIPWLIVCPLLAAGLAAVAARRTAMEMLAEVE